MVKRVGLDLTQLRTQIDTTLQSGRFLDFWESSKWASAAAPVVDALGDLAATSPSAELVELLEEAIAHLLEVMLNADDSSGEIGGLMAALLEFHVVVCQAGAADPVKLAGWLVRFSLDDQDFFVLDPKRYAGALGESGLAVYRQEIDRRRGGEAQSLALHYVDERLAVLDGDVDAMIGLLGGDLTSPHQFIAVTDAMVELGRDDEALAWAQRGIAETDGWQVARLYEVAAAVNLRRDAPPEVLRLRWEEHRRMASTTTYALLRQARRNDGRVGWRTCVGPIRPGGRGPRWPGRRPPGRPRFRRSLAGHRGPPRLGSGSGSVGAAGREP